MWLEALKREANLAVPEPVLNRDISLLTMVSVEGVPQPRDCVRFRWLDGRFVEKRLRAKSLQLAGRFMAKMHRHASQFVLPKDFTRKRWDYDLLMGENRESINRDFLPCYHQRSMWYLKQ